MIMETAYMTILEGKEQEFLEALERAKLVVARAKGFNMLHVHRGIERPNVFMLAIGWDTLEDHTVGFRESELFPEWRSHIGPFFAEPPHVEHWVLEP